jgi:hypothetical protein
MGRGVANLDDRNDIANSHPHSWMTVAKRNVAVLVLGPLILGADADDFAVGGLAGKQPASNICWATLPILLIIFWKSMTTAP